MTEHRERPILIGAWKSEQLQRKTRNELLFALNEAKALLTAAHTIEATLGPLAWSASPRKIRIAAAAARRCAPDVLDRLVNVCCRIERLLALAELDQ